MLDASRDASRDASLLQVPIAVAPPTVTVPPVRQSLPLPCSSLFLFPVQPWRWTSLCLKCPSLPLYPIHPIHPIPLRLVCRDLPATHDYKNPRPSLSPCPCPPPSSCIVSTSLPASSPSLQPHPPRAESQTSASPPPT